MSFWPLVVVLQGDAEAMYSSADKFCSWEECVEEGSTYVISKLLNLTGIFISVPSPVLETGSHGVAQTDSESMFLVPQPPKGGWDCG